MVAAPGRVSTITGWRQLSVIFCPIMRARMSADPPGANGTMILIGFSGYLSAGDCAAAPPGPRTAGAAATAAARTVRQPSAIRCALTFPSPAVPARYCLELVLSLGLQAGRRGFPSRRACLSAQRSSADLTPALRTSPLRLTADALPASRGGSGAVSGGLLRRPARREQGRHFRGSGPEIIAFISFFRRSRHRG